MAEEPKPGALDWISGYRGPVATRSDPPTKAGLGGRLKHGNPSGDPNTAPRCGARARTRGNQPCRAPAVRGGRRCRMHGGASTGPRTAAGLTRSQRARLTHGRYSPAAIARRKEEAEWERFRRESAQAARAHVSRRYGRR